MMHPNVPHKMDSCHFMDNSIKCFVGHVGSFGNEFADKRTGHRKNMTMFT